MKRVRCFSGGMDAIQKGDVIVELKSHGSPSQSRKETILDCLLRGK